MSATNSIIDLLKKNDEKTIRTFYNDHKNKFVLFAKRYNINEFDSIDVYQDAFIALIENVKRGKTDDLKSSLSTYLFGIGKFMIFQKFKKNGQLHIADDVASIEIEEDLYSEDDVDLQVRLLQNGLDKLGEQCKKVLQLFYYEEKKLDEIQEQLGYTSKDVLKSQKSRCLKQLKELIKA
ncbi:MAG TPA: sigma-70 family RNA polymerase sigma factor [Chitinophagales bacterium]|jgi:RNA polymerase sigma factor (sigma-70 family)|nr:sigma-70 family RNA polymerase sigma factor [Chitinophagales bacterium]